MVMDSMGIEDTFNKFRYAKVGSELVRAKDIRGAGKSIDNLAADLGLGPDAKMFIETAQMDERTIQHTLQTANRQYKKAYGEATIEELGNFYSTGLANYFKGDATDPDSEISKVNLYLNEFKDVKYGLIREKIERAQVILKENVFSEKEKKDAESDMKKYQGVYMILSQLEEDKIDPLVRDVQKNSKKDNMNEMAKQLGIL